MARGPIILWKSKQRQKKIGRFLCPFFAAMFAVLGGVLNEQLVLDVKKNCSFLEILQNIRSDKWS